LVEVIAGLGSPDGVAAAGAVSEAGVGTEGIAVVAVGSGVVGGVAVESGAGWAGGADAESLDVDSLVVTVGSGAG
jgi:hypothetical protein